MSGPDDKAETFRALHDGPPVPDPEPVGRRFGPGARGARVPGARDDELGPRLHARPPRRRRDARRGRSPRGRARRSHLAAGLGRPRERLRARAGAAASAVLRAAAAGAAGGSIEDWDPAGTLYDPAHAVERVAAAVEAARGLGRPFVLTARAENHIRGNPDLGDTIARLQAFEQAGADVLYAPGLRTPAEIREVCAAVSKPVNVLALPMLSVQEIFEAGAQRISVGGGLTWVAVRAMADAAIAMRDSRRPVAARRPASRSPTGCPADVRTDLDLRRPDRRCDHSRRRCALRPRHLRAHLRALDASRSPGWLGSSRSRPSRSASGSAPAVTGVHAVDARQPAGVLRRDLRALGRARWSSRRPRSSAPCSRTRSSSSASSSSPAASTSSDGVMRFSVRLPKDNAILLMLASFLIVILGISTASERPRLSSRRGDLDRRRRRAPRHLLVWIVDYLRSDMPGEPSHTEPALSLPGRSSLLAVAGVGAAFVSDWFITALSPTMDASGSRKRSPGS